MKRFKDFLRSKGFYIALSIGIVAFAGLMIVYNYEATTDELKKESAIDLNQPVVKEETDKAADEYETAGSDGAVSKKAVKEKDDIQGKENQLFGKDKTQNGNDLSTETDAKKEVDAKVKKESDDTESKETTVVEEAADIEGSETESVMAELNYEGEQSLAWPLVGDVILPYSMDTTVYFKTLDTYKCNPGMLIEGIEGADIVATYDGKVISIEDSKEFGTVVSVDMGNGYIAKYGQLMNVCVAVGDTVSISQNIGELAPVSNYYVEEGNHLYFEITKDREPVNPINLIK